MDFAGKHGATLDGAVLDSAVLNPHRTDQPAQSVDDLPRPTAQPRVVILVPAHNEEQGIAATVQSLLAQTRRPDRIVVAADNCSDATAEVARGHGAEVMETVGNRAKKAGALNQAFDSRFRRSVERRGRDRRIAALPYPSPDRRRAEQRTRERRSAPATGPDLSDDDYVLAMDADSQLEPDFIENGLALYERVPEVGGLSGAIVAREQANLLERLQAIEYAKGTRSMSRKQGRVHVLSGAATIFPAITLRRVASSRGSELPGTRGALFLEDSLTEDYELTLAVRKLGYRTLSTKNCRVVTDLMPTLGELTLQRVRWQRGAMESLALYGWGTLTRKTWIAVAICYLQSLLLPVTLAAMAFSYFAFGSKPNLWWTAILPLFICEQMIVARRVGGRARWIPLLYVPMWTYECLQFYFAWRALGQLVRRSDRTWIT